MMFPPRSLLRLGFSVMTLCVVATAFWCTLRSSTAAEIPNRAMLLEQGSDATLAPVSPSVVWSLAVEQANGNAGWAQAIYRARPQTIEQAVTLTADLGLHSHLVTGIAPGPEPIQLRLLREGAELASKTVAPFPNTGDGFFYATSFYDTIDYQYPGHTPSFLSGDILEVTQAGRSVSLTVPILIALAEQITGTVYGQAEPAASLDIYFYKYANPNVIYRQTTTATASGVYTADLTAQTVVTARDYGYVFHADVAANRVYVRYNVPFLRVGIDHQTVDGMFVPLTWIAADNLSNRENVRCGVQAADSSGSFEGCFFSAAQMGDTIVVTSQVAFPLSQSVSITVALITARPDLARNTISGEAPPGAVVRVDLYNYRPGSSCMPAAPTDQPSHTVWSTTSATGDYAADFTGVADLVPGKFGFATVTDSFGYQTFRRFFVPILQAPLGAYRLLGLVNASKQVTVTIAASDGLTETVHSVQADDGCFADYSYGTPPPQLLPGDRITVTAQTGETLTLTMPTLSATADAARRLVSGRALPNSPVLVGLAPSSPLPPWQLTRAAEQDWFEFPGFPSYRYTATTISDASGAYTANFDSEAWMWEGTQGAVFDTTPTGNEAYLGFRVSIPRQKYYLPIMIR